MAPPDDELRPAEDEPTYAAFLSDPPFLSMLGLTVVGLIGLQAVPPALPSVGTALAVPDDRVGLVVTAFFAAAALTLPVVGAVADIYGRRRVALVSLALFGLPGLATPFVGSLPELLALRAIQGAAFPGLVPLSITIAGDRYDGTAGSMAQGLRISVNGIAAAATPAVAGVLAGVAWFYPFLLSAVAIPMLGFVFLFLPETKASRGGEGGDDGATPGESRDATHGEDETADDDTSGAGGVAEYAREVAVELRQPRLLVLVLGAFVAFFCQYAVVTFLPLFAVRDLGESAATGGVLLSVVGACQVVVPLVAGPLVERFSRKAVILVALGATAGTTVLFPLASGLVGVALVAVAFGTALSLFFPVINDTVSLMASAERRASVVNAMEFAKIVALGSSPALFGLVLGASGFAVVFTLAGLLLGGYVVVAALLLLGTDFETAGEGTTAD